MVFSSHVWVEYALYLPDVPINQTCTDAIQFDLRMPDPDDEPVEAVKWMVQQLMKDLQEAKMWPIKMASMKHQDNLRSLAIINLYIHQQHPSSKSDVLH